MPAHDPSRPPPLLLDRARFDTDLTLPAARIPARACQAVVAGLKGHLFDLARQPSVVGDDARHGGGGDEAGTQKTDKPAGPTRLVMLRPAWATDAGSGGTLGAADLLAAAGSAPPPDAATTIAALPPAAAAVLASVGATPATATIRLGYAHHPAASVLRALLPPGVDAPASFETVGHIAHLNLNPDQLEHAALIGAVLLDKNPGLRTVVTKVGEISSTFRALPLRVIAGDPDTVATVTQAGCRFKLDYGTVYWNSRLEAEHARCVGDLEPGSTLLDVMAGVGPFAIPAAKGEKGCTVYANDLNPASYEWLCANIGANRVGHAVAPFCVDGRAFIRAAGGAEALAEGRPPAAIVPAPKPRPPPSGRKGGGDGGGEPPPPPRPPLPASIPAGGLVYGAAIMNLPASAVSFLDAFRGAFSGGAWAATRAGEAGAPALPTVHVYTFAATDELEEMEGAGGGKEGERRRVGGGGGGLLTAPAVAGRVVAALWAGSGNDAPTVPLGLAIRLVRDVAPNKRMVRVTFRVPADVAFWEKGGDGGGGKRARVDV